MRGEQGEEGGRMADGRPLNIETEEGRSRVEH